MCAMRRTLIIGILMGMACSPVLGAIYFDAPADAVRIVNPRYPRTLEMERIGGSGVFRLTIDSKTGKVGNVAV
jgi:hypothetical protein